MLTQASEAASAAGSHGDAIASLVLALAISLLAAKIGGDLASRLRQPEVLGELIFGVLLGNLNLIGVTAFHHLKTHEGLDLFAQVGVLILLFAVGLESTVRQMLNVGISALLVAILGVAVPFALGWGVGVLFLPEGGQYGHAFLGATLSATSVGITARVLKDLEKSKTQEARLILGAAVIDDVLGLVVLTVVAGAASGAGQGTSISPGQIGIVVGKAAAFLAGSLTLGVFLSPRLFALASRLHARGVLLAVGLAFCFVLSWLAHVIGLSPIVGAFAAGLILEDLHYREFVKQGEQTLEELVRPIASFLVPVFFVIMGMRADLRALADLNVLALSGALLVAAVLGKLICGMGVLGRSRADRLMVGIGMLPRGEVGLIFASVGMTLEIAGRPLISHAVYSAIVIMVIVTTMVTPPALKWRLGRMNGEEARP